MANEGNVVLSVGVDVSEGKAALAGLADAGESAGKRTAAGMAPAAKGVDAVGDGAQAAAGKLKGLGDAGGEVGKRIGDGLQPAIAGMGGLGDETVHTEEKLNKATARIINQLERQTAAIKDGGTRGAESYAVMAKQQGASIAAIEPYIAALERAKEAAKNIAVPVAPVVSDFEKMAVAAGLPLDAIQRLNASFGAEIGAGKAAADAEKVRESMLRMGEAAGMSEVRMREYAASLGMSADQIAARFDKVVPVVVSDFEKMAAAAGLPADAIQKLNASFGAEIGAGKAAADAEKVREAMLRMGEAAGMSEVRMREYAASLGMSADQIAARFNKVAPAVVSDFERMAAAAGLPADAIQKLNASFGAEIGAGKAAADAEKVRESMLRMGEAAGMSEVRMREYAASLGMSADQIAARFNKVAPAVVSDFERMAAAAGLPLDAIQRLNASFGADIGAGLSAHKMTAQRQALLDMGVSAGLSSERIAALRTELGITAGDTSKHGAGMSNALRKMAEESGMSLGALNNGMRMIPMQMSDIFVSLASGMPPWLVFTQQGAQLKDTLGGTNMALRAVAEYVMGLINPFTFAAVAVGVLALAYNQGSKEADAYRLALVNTGNAAGVTTGQMAGMAKHVGDSVGTTGAAAEALAALAATGVVAGANMEKFATSAIWAHKGLGQEVGETAKVFESLGRNPVEASARLNEQLNYLNASTYSQIRAAMELGDREGAAAIAQQAYATAIEERGKKMVAAMGWIERAAMGAAGGAKSMWDAILNIGREEDPTAKAAAAAVKLLDLRAKLQSGNYGGTGNEQYDRADIESQIAGQERLIASTQKKTAAENAAAKAQAENAATERRKIDWDKRVQAGLPPEERAKRDIKTIRAEGRLAGGTSDEINALVAAASKPLTDKSQQSANERLKIEVDYYKQLTDKIKSGEKLMQSALSAERSAGLIGEVDYFNRRKTLSDNALVDQQASIKLEIKEIKRSGIAQKDKATQIAALNNQIAGLERERVSIAQQAEIDIAAARRKEIQVLATESIGIQSTALESWHKLALVKDADYYENAAENTAKYQQEKANLALQTYLNESRYAVQGSQVEIDARQKMIKVVRDIGLERELASKNAIASAYEYGRTVDLSLQRQAYESSLVLQTSEERTKLLAIYDIEAQKLEKIRQLMATTPAGKARDESIAGIEVAAAKAKQGEVAKVLNAEWKTHLDFAEGVARGIWDDYTSGAGNAAQNALAKLKKELFDEIYKLALKPLVLNVLANITGNPVGGAAAAMGGAGGGISGLLQQAGGGIKDYLFGGAAASSSASYAGAIGTVNAAAGSQAAMLAAQTEGFGAAGLALTTEAAGVATSLSGLASSYGAAIGTTSTAIGSQAAMLAAQTEGFGAAGLALTAEAAGVTAAAGTGMMATLSAAAPWIAGGLMIANAVGLFGGDNNQKAGGTYQYTQGAGVDVWRDEAGRTRLGTGGRVEIGDNLIQKSIEKTTNTINKVLEQIGSVSRVKTLVAGAQSSSEKPEAMLEVYGQLDTGRKFGIQGEQKLNKTASPEEVYGALQTELNRAVLEAVKQAAEIPKSVKDMLAKVDPRGIENDKFYDYIEQIINGAQAAITQQWTGFDVSTFGDLLVGMANTSVGAAEYMSAGISDSIGAAWAGSIQEQFNSAMYTGVLQPIIMTATTAGMSSDLIKEQLGAAQTVIGNMRSQLGAMKEVLQSDDFKGLMKDIGDAMGEAQAPIKELQSYIPQTSKSVKSLADTASSASKDIGNAASSASKDIENAAKKEADEKKGLQDKLDALTMTRSQLLAKERDAVTESNRALFDQLKAREAFDAASKLKQGELDKQAGLRADLIEAQGDSVAATEMRRVSAIKAATEGMNDYNAELVSGAMAATNALEDQVGASKLKRGELDKQAGLQADLIEAQGDSVTAMEMRRMAAIKAATEGMNDYNAKLVSGAMIATNALEDQVSAAKALQSITNSLGDKYSSLQVDLLTAKGDEAGAKRLKRQQELDNLLLNKSDADAAEITNLYNRNAAIEEQIDLAAKAKKAWEDEKNAALDAAKASEDAWKNIRTSLEDEVKKLRGDLFGNTATGLAAAQAEFEIARAQAAAGDQKAAEKLPQLAEKIVEIAKGMGMTGSALRQVTGETAASLEALALATQAQIDQYHAQVTAPVQTMPPASVFGGAVSVGAQVAGPIIIPVNQSSQTIDLNPANQAMMKTLGDVLDKIGTMTNTVATAVSSKTVQQVQVVGPVRTV